MVNIFGKDFFFSPMTSGVRSLELSSTITTKFGGMLWPVIESRVVPRVSSPSLVMMQHHQGECLQIACTKSPSPKTKGHNTFLTAGWRVRLVCLHLVKKCSSYTATYVVSLRKVPRNPFLQRAGSGPMSMERQ